MKNDRRLFSLDILRGLDMFLLTVIGPVFWAANKIWPMPDMVQKQFKHFWGGFTLWDIIMPLFIFMCGAAIPYALSKRLGEDGKPTAGFWGHVFSRVILLWFCGMLVQGNLATLDILRISPYNNTLETIAAGYLIAALVMLVPVRALRIATPVLLVVVYGALLHFLGDYSQTGNFAAVCEAKVLSWILPADNTFMKNIANPESGVPYHGYTWFLTTIMFGFMTLCGAQCAEILRSKLSRKNKALSLFGLAAGLLAAGWGLVFAGIPMIKHIFTVSFTLQAMGWSVLALAILYVVTDIWKIRRGWWIITLFGQCALTAYMVSHFFRAALDAAAKAVVQGLPHLIGDTYMPLVTALASATFLTLACWARRRMRYAKMPEPVKDDDADNSTPPPAPAHDNGAVAERFRLPTAPVQQRPTPEPQSSSLDVATKPISLKKPVALKNPVPPPPPENPEDGVQAPIQLKPAEPSVGPTRSTKTNLKLH